jgi:hypothetical protein
MEERGFEESLSVFICVRLGLHCIVTASRATRRSGREKLILLA